MSEKQNVEEILRKLDEVLPVLMSVLSDLQEISKSLRSVSPSQTQSAFAPQQSLAREAPKIPAATPEAQRRGIPDVRMMFPQELEDLLTFTEKDDYIVIKPRQYLGSENFAKIASIIRGVGGQYISAGKDSHFRVPKQFG